MRLSRHTCYFLFFFLLFSGFQSAQAQLGFELDIKKPEPYDNRELKAEKTGTKKLNTPRRFFQNLTTHYNYFFNANNKINEVIERAKAAHKDDYTQLLPFYNYTLDATSQDKTQLDSVIYKSQTGIVMHDLRSDWADDMYLLWGAAYYFQKKFDSAWQMFQFINWAFAEKEKDGYYKYIGSRMDGGQALSIATREDPSFLQKITSDPPGRNKALLWLVRTFIEMGNDAETNSLIATLKADPNFPRRLYTELDEIQAYWFYRQGMWDSSATHLVAALDRAKNKSERGRWEYLAAQMFDRSGKGAEAEKLYAKAIAHTTDPVLDIYARLNLVRLNKDGGENYLEKNIAELQKMARRDKYVDYRDVIYFMMAQMEMERNNFDAAQAFLLKGSKYNNGNIGSKSKAFLQIADLSYIGKKYKQAASFYDSIQINDIDGDQLVHVETRKQILSKLIPYLNSIALQDSLQRIAAMPEAEKEDYIKRLVKQQRKAQGLGDEGTITTLPVTGTTNNDIFSTSTKGEWYFYNSTAKTQGAQKFKQVWGNRSNQDNWRRASNSNSAFRGNNPVNNNSTGVGSGLNNDGGITYNSVLASLPVTPLQIKSSNDSIQIGLFESGVIYLSEMNDYASAIAAFEELRTRFPSFAKLPEALFHLYYAYSKMGNIDAAARTKKLLSDLYPDSKAAKTLNGKKEDNTQIIAATKDYEAVYDLFLEGRFAEAKEAKRIADSTYGTTTWQPQLLYIEAVYHSKLREDSAATSILTTLVNQNPNTPIAAKANNLINALSRRAQIEDELNRLQIERPAEDSAVVVVEKPLPVRTDTIASKPKQDVVNNKPAPVKQDTIARKPIPQQPAQNTSLYSYKPDAAHYAVVVLNKVDKVFGNEARNAFTRYSREKFPGKPFNVQLIDLDAETKLVLIGEFINLQTAFDYVQQAKPIAASQIVPWLKADKFSFSLISAPNLDVLKANPDLKAYSKFLEQNLPVKF